jgi:photosystem II stability/assembly factor-like uncharacterized protein
MRDRFALSSWLRPIALGTAIVIAVTAAAFAGSMGDRERYDIERQGLENGIPLGAKEAAIEQLRSLPLASPRGPWAAIGPQPITNGQGLGAKGFCGPGTAPPVSGRATSIAFGGVPGAITIYLGTAGGGVWKSTDLGTTWQPLTDQQVSLAIGALAVVPNAGGSGNDVIYAGTGESNQGNFGLGILKSTDGGQTWDQLADETFQNQGFARIAVVPGGKTTSDVLYAATMETFILSATNVSNAPPPEVKPGLFQSTDGGTTWQILSGEGGLPSGGEVNGAASEVVVNPKNSKMLYAGINGETNGGIWQSDDGGKSWTRVPGMPDKVGRVAISISPDGNTLYAAITTINAKDEANLTANFVTINAGKNWHKVGLPAVIKTPKTRTEPECSFPGIGQGTFNLAIQSDPSNPSTVYEALVGIYKSTNGGKNWNFIGTGSHSDFHALAFNGGSLYAANDGGIFVTANGGATWNGNLNQKLNTIQFQSAAVAPGTTNVVGGTQDNGTDVYTGAPAWTLQMEGDGGIAALARTKKGIAFGEYQIEEKEGSDHVARFKIGTKAITLISPPFTKEDEGQFYTPLILDPSNDDRLLVATNRIWESCSASGPRKCNATTGTKQPRDKNKINWRAISPVTGKMFAPTPLTGIAIAPTNPAVLYAITNLAEMVCPPTGQKTPGPFVYVSQNSMAPKPTFTDVSCALSAAGAKTGLTSIAISPIDPATAAVSATGFTGTGGHIFLTRNFGARWDDISTTGGFPNIPTLAVYFDQNDSSGMTLFAGTSIGIMQSTDLGTTWNDLSLNQLPLVQVYSIAEAGTTLTIATHGRGVWQLPLK